MDMTGLDEKLAAEKGKLNQQYQNLKTETAKVERIRSNVYDIMSAERRREQPRRAGQVDPKLISVYCSNRFFSVRYKFARLLSPSLSRNRQKGTLSVSLCFITQAQHFL